MLNSANAVRINYENTDSESKDTPRNDLYVVKDKFIVEYMRVDYKQNLTQGDTTHIFGRIHIPRSKCPICSEYSFIIDGKTTCCDAKLNSDIGRRLIKVTNRKNNNRRVLTPHQKMEILTRQHHNCFYCLNPFYETWFVTHKRKRIKQLTPHFDHLVPYIYTDNQDLSNYVAACEACNLIKSSKMFDDVAELIQYVSKIRDKKGFEVIK